MKRGERGQAVVEFALIFVLFFVLVGVVVQGAFLFNGWLVVTNATREGARAGAPCYGRPSPAPSCSAGDVKTVVDNASGGTEASRLTVAVCVGTDSSTSTQVLTVTATYQVPVFTPLFDQLFPSNNIPVSAESSMRLENQGVTATPACT